MSKQQKLTTGQPIYRLAIFPSQNHPLISPVSPTQVSHNNTPHQFNKISKNTNSLENSKLRFFVEKSLQGFNVNFFAVDNQNLVSDFFNQKGLLFNFLLEAQNQCRKQFPQNTYTVKFQAFYLKNNSAFDFFDHKQKQIAIDYWQGQQVISCRQLDADFTNPQQFASQFRQQAPSNFDSYQALFLVFNVYQQSDSEDALSQVWFSDLNTKTDSPLDAFLDL